MQIGRYLLVALGCWLLPVVPCRASLPVSAAEVRVQPNDLSPLSPRMMKSCQDILEDDPDDLDGCLNLAERYRSAGSFREALALYDQVIDRDPQNITALLGAGECYVKADDYPHSAVLKLFSRVQELAELKRLAGFDYAKLYYQLGNLYASDGEEAKALEFYQKSLAIDGQTAKVHAALARIYYAQGRMDQALPEFQAALRLNPRDTSSLSYLAYVYKARQDYTEAARLFLRVIENGSPSVEAYFRLLFTYEEMGATRLADEYYQKALALFPYNQELLDWAARFFYGQGDNARAVTYTRRAIALGPGNSAGDANRRYFFLMDCYLAGKDRLSALAVLREVRPNILGEWMTFWLLVMLPAMMVRLEGLKMLRGLPTETGELRIVYYRRCRRWLGAIRVAGLFLVVSGFYFFEMGFLASLLYVPEGVLLLAGCTVACLLAGVVLTRFDRQVCSTSSTAQDGWQTVGSMALPYLVWFGLSAQLVLQRPRLLSSAEGVLVFGGFLLALVYGMRFLGRLVPERLPLGTGGIAGARTGQVDTPGGVTAFGAAREVAGKDVGKTVVYFSGSGVFALLFTVILHELGHAFAVWGLEGKASQIAFHPFSGAVTSHAVGANGAVSPDHVFLISAGGIVFGSLFALALGGPSLLRGINFWTAPVALVVVAALAGNGLMLLVGGVMSNVGDAERLLALGVPRWGLVAAGSGWLGLGWFLLRRVAPWIGLGPAVPCRRRILIFLGGLLPYVLCVLGYNLIRQPAKIVFYLAYVLCGLGLGAVAVAGLGCLPPLRQGRVPPVLRWRHALFAAGLAGGLIVFLLVSGCSRGMPG